MSWVIDTRTGAWTVAEHDAIPTICPPARTCTRSQRSSGRPSDLERTGGVRLPSVQGVLGDPDGDLVPAAVRERLPTFAGGAEGHAHSARDGLVVVQQHQHVVRPALHQPASAHEQWYRAGLHERPAGRPVWNAECRVGQLRALGQGDDVHGA